MLHLLGVSLPEHKKVPVALSHFYGIGQKLGQNICNQLSIHPSCKLQELNEDKLNKLGELLNKMTLEGDLKREIKNRILHHRQIGTVTGRKFELGLPVRGQRMRTNARTASRLNRRWLTKDYSTYDKFYSFQM
jgi:small subunit ribosomal protein S13